jgi:hypothetical protein
MGCVWTQRKSYVLQRWEEEFDHIHLLEFMLWFMNNVPRLSVAIGMTGKTSFLKDVFHFNTMLYIALNLVTNI